MCHQIDKGQLTCWHTKMAGSNALSLRGGRIAVILQSIHLLSDEILQDGGFSGRLSSNDGNLGEIDDHRNTETSKGILHAIDDRDQRLHTPVAARHLEAEICPVLRSITRVNKHFWFQF